MTILQVRKLYEYSNPEIAFEYSYEMRTFKYSLTSLLYIDKKGSEMKNSRLRGKTVQISSGFTNEHSPQGWAFNGDLLDKKSKSPLFPGAGGMWLQMTSA